LTFEIFQLEISGIDFNNDLSLNIFLIVVTFLLSHFEISGYDFNEEPQENI